MLLREKLERFRMDKYNNKYLRNGWFEFGDLKKKLKEIHKKSKAQPLIQMQQIDIDEIKIKEIETEMK
jgi:hypothetical protein